MRILLLVDCYLPSTKSSAKQVHDLAVEITAAGHQAVVAAPDPSLERRGCRVTDEDGVTVLRVASGRVKGVMRPLRAINEWRLPSVMWRAGREFFERTPCDLVAYYSPTIFFGPLVRRLTACWGCRSYLILRDIFPQWAVDAGVLRRGGPAFLFFRRKELEQYAAADVIGVQSPANLRYFAEHGWDRRYRLEVLYNWMRLQQPDVPRTDDRQRLGLAGKVVFFYGGNLGVAQDVGNLLRLARGLEREPSAHVLLVGDGSEVPRLRREIADGGLGNITLHPAVDQARYLGMLSEFDVGLISLDRGLGTQNFPGKMLGYMYFGLPILASINPGNDLQEILERHGAGCVTINGDDELLLAHALHLARDAELRRRLGAAGRRLLETTFSAAEAARRLLAHAGPR